MPSLQDPDANCLGTHAHSERTLITAFRAASVSERMRVTEPHPLAYVRGSERLDFCSSVCDSVELMGFMQVLGDRE
jgi:hypothetical protein